MKHSNDMDVKLVDDMTCTVLDFPVPTLSDTHSTYVERAKLVTSLGKVTSTVPAAYRGQNIADTAERATRCYICVVRNTVIHCMCTP